MTAPLASISIVEMRDQFVHRNAEHRHLVAQPRQGIGEKLLSQLLADYVFSLLGDKASQSALLVEDAESLHIVIAFQYRPRIDSHGHRELLDRRYPSVNLPVARQDAAVAVIGNLPVYRF